MEFSLNAALLRVGYIPTVHSDALLDGMSECTLKPLNRSADFELYLPLGFPGRSLNSPNGWNPGVGPLQS